MWQHSSEWSDDLFTYVHSGSGKAKEGGPLVMVATSLCPPAQLRYQELSAGRLRHIKVPLEPSMEILAVYQHGSIFGLFGITSTFKFLLVGVLWRFRILGLLLVSLG